MKAMRSMFRAELSSASSPRTPRLRWSIRIRCRAAGCRLAVADDEVDALRQHLFGILFAEDWAHGVERAVDAALIGRYYERFGDHAVAIARQVCYMTTGRIPEPTAVWTASGPP